jgi:hypothetical protein
MDTAMLAVVHIHKTAGTTLAGIFKHSYGPRHCDVYSEDPAAPYYSAKDLRHLRERFYPRLESILGHDVRAYGDLEAEEPDIRYITFLREPLERCASHYQYDVQVGGVDLPFEEWITHDAVRDRMTRHLAGPDAEASHAIAVLDRIEFVGLLHRFDESLVMMQRKFRIPDVRYARKWVAPANHIKKELLANPETKAMLESVNREDLVLWDHVMSEVYPKQVAEYGPGLESAVAWLQRKNQRMSKRRMWARPRYVLYVAKWRLRYLPWVERRRGASTRA